MTLSEATHLIIRNQVGAQKIGQESKKFDVMQYPDFDILTTFACDSPEVLSLLQQNQDIGKLFGLDKMDLAQEIVDKILNQNEENEEPALVPASAPAPDSAPATLSVSASPTPVAPLVQSADSVQSPKNETQPKNEDQDAQKVALNSRLAKYLYNLTKSKIFLDKYQNTLPLELYEKAIKNPANRNKKPMLNRNLDEETIGVLLQMVQDMTLNLSPESNDEASSCLEKISKLLK